MRLASDASPSRLSACDPAFASALDAYGGTIWHVCVRFGLWGDIIGAPIDTSDDALSSVVIANVCLQVYARGVAYAAIGDVAAARYEASRLQSLMKAPHLATRRIHNNYIWRDGEGVLSVARPYLEGEIAWRAGDAAGALHLLAMAAAAEDALEYDEPPGWMLPVRHAIGCLALEASRPAIAAMALLEDAAVMPDTVWALQQLRAVSDALSPEEAKALRDAGHVQPTAGDGWLSRREWEGIRQPVRATLKEAMGAAASLPAIGELYSPDELQRRLQAASSHVRGVGVKASCACGVAAGAAPPRSGTGSARL